MPVCIYCIESSMFLSMVLPFTFTVYVLLAILQPACIGNAVCPAFPWPDREML
jgi:hypothetical protein